MTLSNVGLPLPRKADKKPEKKVKPFKRYSFREYSDAITEHIFVSETANFYITEAGRRTSKVSGHGVYDRYYDTYEEAVQGCLAAAQSRLDSCIQSVAAATKRLSTLKARFPATAAEARKAKLLVKDRW